MSQVLCLKTFAPNPRYGAEISLLERLEVFKSWGWQTSIDVKTKIPEFTKVLKKKKPQAVLTNYYDFPATAAALKWNPELSFVAITDDEYPRKDKWESHPSLKKFREPYSQLKNILVASQFLRRSVEESYPQLRIHYFPNPIFIPSKLKEHESENFWLFVNPKEVKGLSLMLELAKLNLHQQFVFVRNWGSDDLPEKLSPNIRVIPRQENLWEIYSRAKALLMPSKWNEGFGRIAMEAMAAGLPVIASNRGALPETLGVGGLILPLDTGRWNASLQNDEKFFGALSIKAKIRAENYRRESEARFQELKSFFNSVH